MGEYYFSAPSRDLWDFFDPDCVCEDVDESVLDDEVIFIEY